MANYLPEFPFEPHVHICEHWVLSRTIVKWTPSNINHSYLKHPWNFWSALHFCQYCNSSVFRLSSKHFRALHFGNRKIFKQ